ncbi:MAG: HAD family hydrolase [Alphaproteobacteria bacterium]|nr:HAD family hydrolase [Alphaproteobacteria bacterium]
MDAVFFDLDGTLTDPKPGITRSIRHALERLGRTAPSEDELTWCIGPPLRSSLTTLVGEADADRALAFYRERFADIGLYENSLYPGIVPLLAGLRSRRLFVATSKPTIYAERILAHLGLNGYFEGVFGAELDGARAEKSQLLAYALRETGANPSRTVMVGDREHDMIGAVSNGMTGCGVLYGYGSAEELRAAGAHYLFVTPEDLRAGLN